jgi:hypothetical protein
VSLKGTGISGVKLRMPTQDDSRMRRLRVLLQYPAHNPGLRSQVRFF